LNWKLRTCRTVNWLNHNKLLSYLMDLRTMVYRNK
jgi:hypothetical protein